MDNPKPYETGTHEPRRRSTPSRHERRATHRAERRHCSTRELLEGAEDGDEQYTDSDADAELAVAG